MMRACPCGNHTAINLDFSVVGVLSGMNQGPPKSHLPHPSGSGSHH